MILLGWEWKGFCLNLHLFKKRRYFDLFWHFLTHHRDCITNFQKNQPIESFSFGMNNFQVYDKKSNPLITVEWSMVDLNEQEHRTHIVYEKKEIKHLNLSLGVYENIDFKEKNCVFFLFFFSYFSS